MATLLKTHGIEASRWNGAVRSRTARASVHPGRGTTAQRVAGLGQAISASEGANWRHPWYTSPRWDAKQGRWVAVVKAGFVNGECPTYRMTISEAPPRADVWGINPLSGERFFSAEVFSDLPDGEATTRQVDVPLYLSPQIPLSWRRIGWDGEAGVPAFFARRGVAEPKGSDLEALLGGDTINVASHIPPTGLRLLRSCDIVLHQPRQALASTVTLSPLPTGVSNVMQTLTLRAAVAGDRLKVFATAKYDPQQAIRAGIDPVARDFEEATWDEVLVCRVYALSPLGASPGSEPDASWRCFVRHELFWNLSWAQPGFTAVNVSPEIPFIPPLAGGAAQPVINFLLGELNDATARALSILTAHSMAGSFWTATCGGHDAAEEAGDQSAEVGGIDGLNKDARKLRLKRLAAKAAREERLDPEFPYRGRAFNLSLLSR